MATVLPASSSGDVLSATLTKYINPMKGWQPRFVELDTANTLFTTCHVDHLGLPDRATTTIVDIRGASLRQEPSEPTFTVACVDGTKVSLRCENAQERSFWVSMLGSVGVQEGAAPSASGGGGGGGGGGMSSMLSMGGGLLSRGKSAVASAAASAQQLGSSELMDGAVKMGQKAASGAASIASSLTYSTHNIGGMQIQLGAQLAEGGYSFVHLAEEVGSGRKFAVKRIVMLGGEASQSARFEVDVLTKLQGHPNIMQLFGHGTTRLKQATEMLMVCELCEGGHLYDHYQAMGGAIPEERLMSLFAQCCEAVGHLHSQQPPLAHRDVKIENFLLTGDVVKLCDFGSCVAGSKKYETRKEILDEEEIIQKHSTMMYRAPEMVDLYSGQVVGELVDVWALGCVLFTLAYGKHPFGDAGALHILSGKYTIPDKGKYSARPPAVVAYMLVKTVAERPTVFQSLDYVRTGTAAKGGGGSARSAARPQASAAPADDDFDPRGSAPTPTPAPAPGPAPAPAGGGGGGGLFGMLDWQDDGGAPAPAPAPAAAASGGDPDAFDVSFSDMPSASPAKAAPAPAPAAAGGGNALFGMLDWQDDGGAPAPAPAPAPATPTPAPAPTGSLGLGLTPAQPAAGGGDDGFAAFDDAFDPRGGGGGGGGGGGFEASFDDDVQPAPAKPSAGGGGGGGGGGNALFAQLDWQDDGAAALAPGSAPAPAPAPTPQAASTSPAEMDFFSAPASSPPPVSSSSTGDLFGTTSGGTVGAAPVPMATMQPTVAAGPAPRPAGQKKQGGGAFDSLSWS